VIVKLKSKRLALLFAEVLERIPEQDRALIYERTRLVMDNPNLLPNGQRPTWGATIGISFRKTISIIYLSPHKLPQQPDDFIRYVIAHQLAHICFGHTENSSEESVLDIEADQKARLWAEAFFRPKK
jgi:hypothetical protein